MKKVQSKNKTRGLFGIFATLALAIGVGVSLAPKEVVQTKAAEASVVLVYDGYNPKLTQTATNYTKISQKGYDFTATGLRYSTTNHFLGANGSHISNSNSLGVINRIVISKASGQIASVTGNVYFSNSAITSASGLIESTFSSNMSGTSTTITAPANSMYFRIARSSGNLQFGNVTVYYEPTPTIAVGSVTVSPDKASVFVGGTTQLSASVSPEGAPDGVTWSSSDNSVATVSANGLVTGIKADTVTITATSTADNTKKGEAEITVMPVVVQSVSLNKTSVELYEGKTELLTATVLPGNATNKNVTWDSLDTNVVTVNNGLLTAVGAGTTTVNVTTEDGAKTAEATVTVLANPVTTLIVNHTNVKKTYALGEDFDGFIGLVVKERRASGEEATISDYSISEIDTMELGKQVVRVEKGAFHEEFVVIVTNESAVVGSVNIPGVTYTETFSSFSSGGNDGSYLARTTNGSNGQVFTITDARVDSGLTIRNGSMTTQFKDGLSKLAFEYRKNYSDTNAYFEVHINGSIVGERTNVANNQGLTIFTLDNLSYKGNVDLEIKVGSRVLFSYLDWTTAGVFVDGMSYETQAKAFARFVGRATPSGLEGRLLPESLGPATQLTPTWEEVETEKGAMDPESLEVFETSDDPEIVAGREIYQELYEENNEAYAAAVAFNDYIMGLTSAGDVTTLDCLVNFNLAKEEWNSLSVEARLAFLDNASSSFAEGHSRLLHWAFVNGWELNGTTLQEKVPGGSGVVRQQGTANNIATTLVIGIIGLTTITGFYFIQKKQENKA